MRFCCKTENFTKSAQFWSQNVPLVLTKKMSIYGTPTVLTLLYDVSTLLFVASTLLYDVSTLLYDVSTLLYYASTLLYDASTLLYDASTLFYVSTLLYDASTLFHVSTLLYYVSTLLYASTSLYDVSALLYYQLDWFPLVDKAPLPRRKSYSCDCACSRKSVCFHRGSMRTFIILNEHVLAITGKTEKICCFILIPSLSNIVAIDNFEF